MAQPLPPPNPYLQQPPKKSSTLKIVLITLGVIMVLGCGGCFAFLGLAANEVDKAVKEEEANDKPTDIAEGKAFTHDEYAVDAGWSIVDDGLGDFTIEGMTATNENVDESPRTAFLDFRILRGTTVLGTISCSTTADLETGQSSALDCFSADDFTRDYDTVQVADSF